MQKFTVKISYQKGRKLGFVLADSLIEPGKYYESDTSDGEMAAPVNNIRGGGEGNDIVVEGETTLEVLRSLDKERAKYPNSPPLIGGSLQADFTAEAIEAEKVKQGTPSPPCRRRVASKRKRPTRITVSMNSIVFLFAKQLHDKSKENELNTSNIDKLVEWGREHMPDMKFGNGSVPFNAINDEAMKFVLTDTIQAGDIVEKIQYTRKPHKLAKVLPAKKSLSSKRRCRAPYYRSDHYTTFLCENKESKDLANILRDDKNFPLYITFKRPSVLNVDDSGGSTCSPPPRKRAKRSDSNIGGASAVNTQQAKDEVICLLDSSDEEENEGGKDGGGNTQSQADTSLPQVSMEVDSTTSTAAPLPTTAPPDPVPTLFNDDDFVLTPFGPGKILSSRVERYAASSGTHLEATIFKPTIIYSIDLHFGICHVPASKVKSISGTSYTEKTLITYQRAPLTGHDLLRLRPMTYLNDCIINFYLKYLRTQYEQNNKCKAELTKERGWDDLNGEGIHIFPTFCYTRIKNIMGPGSTRNSKSARTKIWSGLKTWTKNTDIFKKKLLVFPINEHLHWTVVFVCHPGRLVRRYAKGLPRGKKETVINVDEKVVAAKPVIAQVVNPSTNTSTINIDTKASSDNNKKVAEPIMAHVVSTSATNANPNTKASNSTVVSESCDNDSQRDISYSNKETVVEVGNNDCQNVTFNNSNMGKDSQLVAKSEATFNAMVAGKDVDTDNDGQRNDNQKDATDNIPANSNTAEATDADATDAEDKPQIIASTANDSTVAKDDNSASNDAASTPPVTKSTKWACDFCTEAQFLDYDEACEHEKICEKNIDWCMIHFDSGKHFKLHKTTEITGNIRKYLNAYYEAEYASTHPGMSSITIKNMPSFTATGLPQQDNTKVSQNILCVGNMSEFLYI